MGEPLTQDEITVLRWYELVTRAHNYTNRRNTPSVLARKSLWRKELIEWDENNNGMHLTPAGRAALEFHSLAANINPKGCEACRFHRSSCHGMAHECQSSDSDATCWPGNDCPVGREALEGMEEEQLCNECKWYVPLTDHGFFCNHPDKPTLDRWPCMGWSKP